MGNAISCKLEMGNSVPYRSLYHSPVSLGYLSCGNAMKYELEVGDRRSLTFPLPFCIFRTFEMGDAMSYKLEMRFPVSLAYFMWGNAMRYKSEIGDRRSSAFHCTLITEGALRPYNQMVNQMVNCRSAGDALLAALTVVYTE